MPQSLDLAAFVFGAVLILLSLVAGSFKIFGAEVQGTVGRFGRVIAFLLGLILIASRLIPSDPVPPVVAHVETDAATAPVKAAAQTLPPAPAPPEPADDDTPARPPAQQDSLPANELLVGTWKADYPVSEGSMKTKIRYERGGTFSGTEHIVSSGLNTEISTSGTWRVRQLSPTRFKLTTRSKELRDPETYTFRVIDHEKLRNEDLDIVVQRVAGD